MLNKSPKDVIKDYLDKRAAADPQFAVSYAKKNKSIDDCFNYILGEARSRGSRVCMTDEEVFGLAVHYYDEDNIKVKPVGPAKAVVADKPAPKVKLSAKEKEAAKEEARRLYQQECLAEIAKKEAKKKRRPAPVPDQTPSLFEGFDL